MGIAMGIPAEVLLFALVGEPQAATVGLTGASLFVHDDGLPGPLSVHKQVDCPTKSLLPLGNIITMSRQLRPLRPAILSIADAMPPSLDK